MKPIKDFDYDLWTTEEGPQKKYWIRVKATGEVSEVDHDVMKFLRNEERTLRRTVASAHERGGADLSYEAVPAECDTSTWLRDPQNFEADFIHRESIADFRQLLTPLQRSVFDECMIDGKTLTEYATEHGVSVPLISKRIKYIRKKAEKFFEQG